MARGTGESSREAGVSTVPAVGKTKRRWQAYQAKSRDEIMDRADGKCEGCGLKVGRIHLAWHHVFGRRAIVAEPLASHPVFGAALCSQLWIGALPADCHREIHADIPGLLNKRIRIAALQRAWQTFGFAPCEPIEEDALNGYARAIERMLKDDGTWLLLREAAGR
jgi:hypothetical protein